MPKFLSAIGVCVLFATRVSYAQTIPDVSDLALPGVAVWTNLIPRLPKRNPVVVRLVDAPLAVAHGRDAKRLGGRLSLGTARLRRPIIAEAEEIRPIVGLRGRELGRPTKALNALFSVDAGQVPAIAALPGVFPCSRFNDTRWICPRRFPTSARPCQSAGVDGTGVRSPC